MNLHSTLFYTFYNDTFVYHGDKILEIKLRFSGEAAKRAQKVQFHKSQKMRRVKGGLVVELYCQGHRELIHELCHPDWLGQVKIISPESLRFEFDEYIKNLRGVTY